MKKNLLIIGAVLLTLVMSIPAASGAMVVKDYNVKSIRGEWGIFDTHVEGPMAGYLYRNHVIVRATWNEETAYFHLILNREAHTFHGTVEYHGSHNIVGTYTYAQGYFAALWECASYRGWMTGTVG